MNSRMDVNDGKHKPFFWKVNVVTSAASRGFCCPDHCSVGPSSKVKNIMDSPGIESQAWPLSLSTSGTDAGLRVDPLDRLRCPLYGSRRCFFHLFSSFLGGSGPRDTPTS